MVNIAKVVLSRKKQYSDLLRNYRVILDGEEIGKIFRGERKEFSISPGKHEIELKIDWCGSNKLNFEIKDNETINFNCKSTLEGWELLLMIVYLTELRDQYLNIDKVE